MEVAASRSGRAERATVVPTGRRHRKGAIVPFVNRRMAQDQVGSLAQSLHEHARVEVRTDRVLGIGIDLTNPRSYSMIAFSG